MNADAARRIDQMEIEFKADMSALNEMTLAIANKKEIDSEIDVIGSSFVGIISGFCNLLRAA
jgi:hypothetical protein